MGCNLGVERTTVLTAGAGELADLLRRLLCPGS